MQAVTNAAKQSSSTLASNLVLVLLKDNRTSQKLTNAIVDRLAHATSFNQANELARILAEEAPLPSKDQAEHLRKAAKKNTQLQGAFQFDGYLSSIEARMDSVHGAPEEPF